jgi:hypothetical protein
MTIQEMHYQFDLLLDKVSSSQKPNFNVAEKDWILNHAQELFVKQRYSGNNYKRTALESTQKRIDDLRTIHVQNVTHTSVVDLTGGIYEFIINDANVPNYLFMTRGTASVTDLDGCNGTAILKVTQTDDISEVLKDPFRSPDVSEIPCNYGTSPTGSGSSLYLYSGTNTINSITISYLRSPVTMSYPGYTYIDGSTTTEVGCELPPHTHAEIIDIAVKVASGTIESPEFMQIKSQKLMETE